MDEGDRGQEVKIFVAEIGGVPVVARGFENLEAASAHWNERVERWVWESDPDRPKFGPGFVVREATEAEADLWRQARTIYIKGKSEIGLNMNPALYIGVVTHGTK
jgi:hypothetical protein